MSTMKEGIHDGIMKRGMSVILVILQNNKIVADSSRWPHQYIIFPYRK